MSAKIFLEFVALIIRSRIYTEIKDEAKSYDSVPNYMNVPSAIKELEKIEMSRQLDGKYRLDYAVTATQKAILKAFGLDENNIKYRAEEIGRQLMGA